MALEWEGALSLLLQRDNPTGNAYADHLHQYQRGREAFLNGPYEAMLVIESDVIAPVDTLWRLEGLGGLGADVAYGVYVFRAGGVVNVLERYQRGGGPTRRGIRGRV